MSEKTSGMIVINEDDCAVNVAKLFMRLVVDESCGKCTPCRIGTKRLLEILEKIADGNGTEEDLSELEELGDVVRATAICEVGRSASYPVLSTLKHFRDEYLAHVRGERCAAASTGD